MTATIPPTEARAFLDPMAPSLASLLAALAAMDLPPRRVADLCSAVRSLCRVLGKTPAEVPADPGVLGRALRRALPATAGISPARWANIKSLVLQALRLTGCRVLPGRSLHPLTPAWAALNALLPTRYDRAGLSRLMHYCAGQGIPPDAVDQAVFDRFGAAILNDSFIRNQRVAHQTAARLWNRAVATIPGWPQQPIVQPRYAKPYVLRLDVFPASFQDEVEAWLRRLAGEGPLEEGPLRPLRPRSLEQRRFYLRQAASALVHSGRDAASIAGLGDLVTVAAMQAILRFFLARSGNKPTSQIHGLATHLKAIARHHDRCLTRGAGAARAHGAPGRPAAERPGAQEPAGAEAVRGSRAAAAAGPAGDGDLRHLAAGGRAAATARGAALPVGPGGAAPAGRPDPAGQSRRARARPPSAAHRHRQAAALPPADPRRGGQERPAHRAAAAGRGECPARALPHPGAAGARRTRHELPVPGRSTAARRWSRSAARSAACSRASSACG